MDKEAFKRRTKTYALQVINLVQTLPRNREADILGRQLMRSATSVGANYRAACRAKSAADFISKMGTVEEEADESTYWLELLEESGIVRFEQVKYLIAEGNELVAMTVASITTVKSRRTAA